MPLPYMTAARRQIRTETTRGLSGSCRASHADMVTRISIVRSHRGSERDYLCVGAKLYARR